LSEDFGQMKRKDYSNYYWVQTKSLHKALLKYNSAMSTQLFEKDNITIRQKRTPVKNKPNGLFFTGFVST